MTWYTVFDENGELQSVGSVLAEDISATWSVAEVPDEVADAFRSGRTRWADGRFRDVPVVEESDAAVAVLLADGIIDASKEAAAKDALAKHFGEKETSEVGEIAVP